MEGVEPHVGIKKLVFERGDEHIRCMSMNVEEAVNQLLRAIRLRPCLGVVLGSAFGDVVNELEVDAEVVVVAGEEVHLQWNARRR